MADILVLGASGKVGRLMRAQWQAPGLRVLWQGRSMAAASGWTAWAPDAALPPVPVLLLLSGVTAGDAAALAQNTAIGLAVARAARAAGVGHILLASTMAAYGVTAPGGATEAAPATGARPYGLAKLAMEVAMTDALQGSATGLTALRIGNVAGADMLGMAVAAGNRLRLDRFADGVGPLRSYAGPGQLVRVTAGLTRHVLAGRRLPARLNVAGQAPVAMADILQAAGLPFDWQAAGPAAVQCIQMCCAALAELVPPDPAAESAAGLVAEWRLGGTL